MAAELCEAGYPDPWDMTPRQILHRYQVHQRIKNRSDVRELEIAVLGSRGEQKALTTFMRQRSGQLVSTASQSAGAETIPELEAKQVSPAQAARLDRNLAGLNWTKRD